MTTIRNEQLWKDQVTDAMSVVLEGLEEGGLDLPGALRQTEELREALGWYDGYKPTEISRTDRLDHVLKLLDFLRNELELRHTKKAQRYARSVLEILN